MSSIKLVSLLNDAGEVVSRRQVTDLGKIQFKINKDVVVQAVRIRCRLTGGAWTAPINSVFLKADDQLTVNLSLTLG